MRLPFPALFTGILFGAGLALSDMINPARVLDHVEVGEGWRGWLLERQLIAPGEVVPMRNIGVSGSLAEEGRPSKSYV